MNGDFARVFDAALNDRPGELVTALGELSEVQLVRVVDAARLVDERGQDLGEDWFDWERSPLSPVSEGRTGRSS